MFESLGTGLDAMVEPYSKILAGALLAPKLLEVPPDPDALELSGKLAPELALAIPAALPAAAPLLAFNDMKETLDNPDYGIPPLDLMGITMGGTADFGDLSERDIEVQAAKTLAFTNFIMGVMINMPLDLLAGSCGFDLEKALAGDAAPFKTPATPNFGIEAGDPIFDAVKATGIKGEAIPGICDCVKDVLVSKIPPEPWTPP